MNDKIVVKPINKEKDDVTESGIILPDTVDQGKLLEGEVVSIGEGMYSASGTLIPVICDVGNTILYNKNAHKSEHTMDGETYILMSVNEVMAIVKEKE